MYQHKTLAAGRWDEMSLAEQMANIGSEVSRSIRWKSRNDTEKEKSSVDRALELFDLSIDCATRKAHISNGEMLPVLKELARSREVFCDYFFGENEFKTDPQKLLAYFDQFTIMVRR